MTDSKENGCPANRHAISATMEDYLEAIYVLADRDGTARVSAIADALGVKPPSVSKAIKRLSVQELIHHTPYGGVGMTSRGRKLAQAQVRIHAVLTRFLADVLKLPTELAEHDACLIEHAISPETVERLVEFIDRLSVRGERGVFRKTSESPRKRRAADRSWKSRV